MMTLQATQYQVLLSVNVITQDDTGLRLVVLPLLSLSWLIMVIWKCQLLANRFRFELAMKIDSIIGRLSIAGMVLSIGFHSFAWGMGL